MDDSFCLWAPWVFSALAGTAGWLLRWWYDDHKMAQLHSVIKTKDEDLYHLNEAHNLLLVDKRTKISAFESDVELKDRTISELRQSLTQAETTNKSLLGQVVEGKSSDKDSTSRPLAAVTQPSATVSMIESDNDADEAIEKEMPPTSRTSHIKKKKRRKRCKKKLTKVTAINKDLKKENERLLVKLSQAHEAKKVIKEIPVTILKTISITEKVDREKLKKLIRDLPLIKSKRKVSKKKKRGKARIVS